MAAYFFAKGADLIQQNHPQTDQTNGRFVGTVYQGQHIPHIAQVGELASFLQGDVPSVGLIVDVIAQMLRHLHGVQFLDVIPPQIVVVVDVGVNIVSKKGYDTDWIHQRLLSIRVRNELTSEWQERDVQQGKEYIKQKETADQGPP